MTDRVPLLEMGKLLAGVEQLKAKKGEPPWSDPVVSPTTSRRSSSAMRPGTRTTRTTTCMTSGG